MIFFAVCVHGRHSEAHGAVRLLHHGADWTQAAHRDHLTRHQPVLVPLLHVQSWTSFVDKRKNIGNSLSEKWFATAICFDFVCSMVWEFHLWEFYFTKSSNSCTTPRPRTRFSSALELAAESDWTVELSSFPRKQLMECSDRTWNW
jgi:hypothetical protein